MSLKLCEMPSSGRRKDKVDYFGDYPSSDDESYSQRKGSIPRVYRPGVQREDSLVKRKEEPEKADSGWDTDYDPRDKYYLSADDDPFDLYSPERKASTTDDHHRHRRRSRKPHSSEHTTSSRHRSPSHSQSQRQHARHRSRSHSRDRERKEDPTRKHKSTTDASSSRSKPPRSNIHTNHSRPKPSRAPSSYAASRSTTRPRPVRSLSRRTSSTNASKQTKFPRDLVKLLDPDTIRDIFVDFPWDEAGKVALQAGTVAAVKVGTDSIPWHIKGTKIASAALGAAVVDHVLKPKKRGGVKYAAMRHLTEVAVGNLVVGPAMGRASSKTGGGGRSGGKR